MKGRKPNLVAIEGGRAPGRCPAAPSWISAHARGEWNRTATELHARGLLHPDTMATLESYCVAVGLVRECEETMIREGRFITTEGRTAAHPAYRVQMAAMREARLLATELGLTPHRRGKDGSPGKDKPDAWDSDLLA